MVNYPVGDFLIRLKNAAFAKRKDVVVPSTKLIKAVAEVLVKEGYLDKVTADNGNLIATLKYKAKEPVLMNLKLKSKLGLRVYMNVDELKAVRGSYILILSTPLGVMSSREAIKRNAGGEVIAEVY